MKYKLILILITFFMGGSNVIKAQHIAANSSGDFVITWVDNRNGNSDIYAQRYSSDGTAIGNNFRVNDDGTEVDYQYSPSVAIDNSGNFIITWYDYRRH